MAAAHVSAKLVDGLFRRVLAEDLPPGLKESLQRLGIPPRGPLTEPLSRETWQEAVALTAAALYPGETGPVGLRRLGLHVVDALERRRVVRGTWFSVAKLMGPRRALRHAAEHSLRVSPVELDVRALSDRSVELVVGDDRQLEFLAGLLEGLLLALGARRPKLEIRSTPAASSALLAARWE